MDDKDWSKEKISLTPITLYMEYLDLKYNDYLKKKFKTEDINPGDFTYIINIFYHENLSQKDLAELLFVSEANVAKILKKLDNKGYILRLVDEKNNSRHILKLTEKGKVTASALIKSSYEWENKITKSFNDEELDKLRELLYQLSFNSTDF